jgi:uncharacterized repeat protein (TIGR02543 family)
LINGNVVAKELCPNKIGKVPQNYIAEVKDGILTVRAQNSATANDKPLISWIKVTKATHNVKYDANGGEGILPVDSGNYDVSNKATIQANTLTKTGYTFVGWNTAEDGRGKNYDPTDSNNNTLTIGSSNVTLYAQWKANTVSMTTPAAVELIRNDDTLTAKLKTQDGSEFTTGAAVKYEWYRDNKFIEDEDSKKYNLSDSDKGTSIKVKVPQYGLKSESINIPNNSPDKPTPIDKVIPVKVDIKGTEIVGDTLEAQLLSENGVEFTTSAAVTYKWYRLSSKDVKNGESVGTDKSYKLVDIDEGKYIRLVATCEGKTFDDITSMISKKSSSSSNHHKHKSSSSSTSTTTSEIDDKAVSKTDDKTVSNTETSKLSNNELTTIINGWKNNNDNTWIYNENGKPVSDWKQVDGAWYLMDSFGIMQTGWKQTNGDWYFLKDNGAMATGWVQINGKWYYLYNNGVMATNTVIDGYKLSENGAWDK